jgi:serine/threonine protein kinase
MPPEALRCGDTVCPNDHEEEQNMSALGTPIDVWALGVLLHELLLGKSPFHRHTVMQTAKVPVMPPF